MRGGDARHAAEAKGAGGGAGSRGGKKMRSV